MVEGEFSAEIVPGGLLEDRLAGIGLKGGQVGGKGAEVSGIEGSPGCEAGRVGDGGEIAGVGGFQGKE